MAGNIVGLSVPNVDDLIEKDEDYQISTPSGKLDKPDKPDESKDKPEEGKDEDESEDEEPESISRYRKLLSGMSDDEIDKVNEKISDVSQMFRAVAEHIAKNNEATRKSLDEHYAKFNVQPEKIQSDSRSKDLAHTEGFESGIRAGEKMALLKIKGLMSPPPLAEDPWETSELKDTSTAKKGLQQLQRLKKRGIM